MTSIRSGRTHIPGTILWLAALVLVAGACLGGASSEATRPPARGMPIVALTDLPPEAAATSVLIQAGGPFPFRQDGAVFQNREGLLPDRAAGYYREFTVPTPGATDRGARRIVAGAGGEMYWTADHYDSFAWIDP